MIKEAYCSVEICKLLEQKGFNYQGFDYIDFEGEVIRQDRPTHQMALTWLRKVHHIHIGINPISGKGYNATIYDVADFDDCGIISDTEFFFHPEETVEAALKYCLENLI